MASVPQPSSHESGSREDLKWQKRLLPLMTRMIVWLTVFFFWASFSQLAYLHWRISRSPALDVRDSLSMLSGATTERGVQNTVELAKLKALIALEANGLEQQYHQANVLLMSRIWTAYLGFVTGMILSLVGASFVLGKLREGASEMILRTPPATDVSFRSTSPGLLLVMLGSILMLTAIVTNHRIDVTHRAVYLRDSSFPVSMEPSPAPVLENPMAKDPKRQLFESEK